MVLRTATVHFPNGDIRYVRFATYDDSVSDDLYVALREPSGAPDGDVSMCDPAGNPLPKYLDRPLSAPEDLIVVRVKIARYSYDWPALYCPQRQHLLGPYYAHNASYVQEECEMVEQGGLHHLVRKISIDHGTYSMPGLSAATLCGAPVVGEVVPFHVVPFYGSVSEQDYENPPERDLYEAWNNPKLCHACLLTETGMNFPDVRTREYAEWRAKNAASAVTSVRKGWWQRLFGS